MKVLDLLLGRRAVLGQDAGDTFVTVTGSRSRVRVNGSGGIAAPGVKVGRDR
jgi:hypothetical protein